MKSKQTIINETATFYNLNNRAITPYHSCVYLNDDGKKCAVGRCLLSNCAKKIKGLVVGIYSLAQTSFNLEKSLKKAYRGHSIKFWEDLQFFHDNEMYWDEDGLSLAGQLKKEELLNKYAK